MEINKKKITKMSDELLKYYFNQSAKDIHISITETETQYMLESKARLDLTEEKIEYIISNFSNHKDLEYECYWELMGECADDDDELELLFLTSDVARVYYEDNYLIFHLYINK